MYYSSQTEAEIHLIKEGYRGPVIIFFDRTDGDTTFYEDERRVYEIPSDGVLRTQFAAPKEGIIHDSLLKYYYISRDGKRSVLPVVQRKDQMLDSNKVYVFMKSYGVFGAKQGKRQQSLTYMVGKVSDDEQLWFHKVMQTE